MTIGIRKTRSKFVRRKFHLGNLVHRKEYARVGKRNVRSTKQWTRKILEKKHLLQYVPNRRMNSKGNG